VCVCVLCVVCVCVCVCIRNCEVYNIPSFIVHWLTSENMWLEFVMQFTHWNDFFGSARKHKQSYWHAHPHWQCFWYSCDFDLLTSESLHAEGHLYVYQVSYWLLKLFSFYRMNTQTRSQTELSILPTTHLLPEWAICICWLVFHCRINKLNVLAGLQEMSGLFGPFLTRQTGMLSSIHTFYLLLSVSV